MRYRTYIDGNTVRKVAVEERPERSGERRRERRRIMAVRREKQRVLRVSIGYVAFLTATLGLVLFGCVWYLQLQAQMTAAIALVWGMV